MRDEIRFVVRSAMKLLKKRPAQLLGLIVLDGLEPHIAGNLVGLQGSSLYEAISRCHAAAARVMDRRPELEHIPSAKFCRRNKA